MGKRLSFQERLAEWFFEFKQRPLYTLIFFGWVAIWLVFHALYHFDKDFGTLNLCLSIGAELQGILLIADMARAEKHRRRQELIAHRQSEAMLTLLKAIREGLHDKDDQNKSSDA